jgi:Ca-activated chloride channel homolog
MMWFLLLLFMLRLPDPGGEAYRQGNYAEARRHFEQDARKKKDFSSRFNLGNACYQQGDYLEAISTWALAMNAAQTAGQRSSAWYNTGNAYYESGRFEEAIAAYQKALTQDPYLMEARQNLTLSYQQLRKNEAEAKASAAADKAGQPPTASGVSSGAGGQPENLSAEELEALLQAVGRAEEQVLRKNRLGGDAPPVSGKAW